MSLKVLLSDMSEEEFIQQREATICELLIQPKTMDGRNNRYLDQIGSKVYDFRKSWFNFLLIFCFQMKIRPNFCVMLVKKI